MAQQPVDITRACADRAARVLLAKGSLSRGDLIGVVQRELLDRKIRNPRRNAVLRVDEVYRLMLRHGAKRGPRGTLIV